MDSENQWPERKDILALGSPLVRRVETYREIDSTQRRARELAQELAQELALNETEQGALVVSRVQSGGRGRLGRAWGSPAGGLWMSLVLRPEIEPRLYPRVTLAAAVAMAKTLRIFGVEGEIKWPNDLLVSGRKVCGILAQSTSGLVVLGVGLNANLDARSLGLPEDGATSLRHELGRDVDLLSLLGSFLRELEVELGRLDDLTGILRDWRLFDCTLGRRVRVRRLGETLEGVAEDIGEEGALILRTDSGTVELFEGDVEGLRPRGSDER